jgi:serine/threonine protein kinase
MDGFERGDLLETDGSGAAVFRGTRKSDGVSVLMKQYAGAAKSDGTNEKVMTEAGILMTLEHPNILPLLDFSVGQSDIWLIFPLTLPGSEPVVKAAEAILPEAELVEPSKYCGPLSPTTALQNLGFQVASALEYLHIKGVVHGDVKPSNVLLEGSTARGGWLLEESTALLTGFGSASKTGEGSRNSSAGSSPYAAPEILRNSGEPHSPAADIWSFGATMLAIGTGHRVGGSEEAITKLKDGTWTFASSVATMKPQSKSAWDGLDSGMQDWITSCLEMDPSKRPTASELTANYSFRGLAQRAKLASISKCLEEGKQSCSVDDLIILFEAPKAVHSKLIVRACQAVETVVTANTTSGERLLGAILGLVQWHTEQLVASPEAGHAVIAALRAVRKASGGLSLSASTPMDSQALTAVLELSGRLQEKEKENPTVALPKAASLALDMLSASINSLLAMSLQGAKGLQAAAVVHMFASGVPNSFAVTQLDFTTPDCELGDEAIGALAPVLASCFPSLSSLRLANNKIGDAGVSVLASYILPRLSELQELTLSGNSFTASGYSELVAALPSLSDSLESLSIGSVPGIGHDGAIKLAEKLPRLPNLKNLVCSACDFGDKGAAAALAAALPSLRKLAYLEVHSNGFSSEDEKAISDAALSLPARLILKAGPNGEAYANGVGSPSVPVDVAAGSRKGAIDSVITAFNEKLASEAATTA